MTDSLLHSLTLVLGLSAVPTETAADPAIRSMQASTLEKALKALHALPVKVFL